MAWDYTEKTTQLFMDAVQGKPGTHLGQIQDPDGFGEHGSIACGDAMRFSFRVNRHPTDPTQDVIIEARYLTFGCTSAIASSEALCALLEEQTYTPIGALQIKNSDIVKYLGGLPPQKLHCSVMGAEALEAAVFNWAQKRGVDLAALGVEIPSREEQEGRVVCQCYTLTEPYIRRKIKELKLETIVDITNAIKAGGACMSCHHAPGGLQDLLDESWGRPVQQPEVPGEVLVTGASEAAPSMSPYRFAKSVERVVDEYVRPMLQQDGGDVEIVDIKNHTVYAQLTGSCSGCAGARATLRMIIEQTLKDRVDERIRIVPV
jgi:NifU-like protein